MPEPAPICADQLHVLQRELAGRVREHVVLAPLTTFRVGGPAAAFFSAESTDDLARAVSAARAAGIDYFLLGAGANILIGDRGYPGLIIHNNARRIRFDGDAMLADSGALIYPDVIEAAVSRGLSGLEHYVGIPSTVGGALWQNLHFLSPPPDRERTMFIAEVVEAARLLTAEGDDRWVDRDYFDFGYDYSILHERPDLVLEARFQLSPAPQTRLREIMRANLDWRGQRHPPLDSEPSAGSIFRKIEGIGAGRLIDECGLKGLRSGGAQISPRHANIIVNTGDATAADICSLIMHVQRVVQRETGYWLTPEISFVGKFDPVRRL